MQTRRFGGMLTACTILLAPAACGDGAGEAPADGPPQAAPDTAAATAIESVELIDSIPWEDELGGGVLHRVLVRWSGGADTIPAITTGEAPVVAGDSLVAGFSSTDGRVVRGFVYDPARRRVESVPLPADFAGFLAHAISPGARWMAYVGKRDDGLLDANVVRWPSGETVYESHPVEGYPSDARNSRVDWSGDGVEVRIRLPVIDPETSTWLVVTGSPASGTFAADTVSMDEG